MKNLFVLLCFGFLFGAVHAQPTENPYRSLYPGLSASHWTEVLKWSSVYNVVDYGAIPNDGLSDQQATEAAISAAHSAGGGVVFFPAGTYRFTDDLLLKPGVLLRGENTSLRATDPAFRPASRLEFPRYVFDTLANGGRGNANSTAFKLIGGIGDFRNVGIVNLDINRARIEMHPHFDSVGTPLPGTIWGNFQPREKNRNCLILGVRSNNAAMPDPNLPDTSGPAKMRKWQRAPYRFAANIDLYFDANVVIANNRLNDAPTDNFDQPGYRVRNQCSMCNTYRFIGEPNTHAWNAENYIAVVSGEHARFRYEDHAGISLNRHKKVILNGRQSIRGYQPQPEPWQEPSLYAKGFSVLDNWVYKTRGVGLWVAGQGMEIKRNIVRDSAASSPTETPKKMWLNSRFTEIQQHFPATYENRGIDFAGARIVIDSNDLQVRTHVWPELGGLSQDGEGILDGGGPGGSRPNGVVVSRNTVDGNRQDPHITFGVFQNKEANNLVFRENRAVNQNGWLIGLLTEGTMSNVLAENNEGLRGIQLISRGGGYGSLVQNNPAAGGASGNLSLSCHVRGRNNLNFLPSVWPAGCQENLASALDTSQFPGVWMVSPRRDTSLFFHPGAVLLEAKAGPGEADSVVFFRDAVHRIGKATLSSNGLWSLIWMPPFEDGVYYITAQTYRQAPGLAPVRGLTAPLLFEINDGNPWVNNPRDQILSVGETVKAPSVWLYPNPARDRLSIRTDEDYTDMEFLDVLGRKMPLAAGKNPEAVDVSPLAPGLYTLRLRTSRGLVALRFRKE